ncbi:MAG: hypothetical protein F4179_00255 [Gammaproteobacteria bacterium]|nr:hypothetical protein [Gammaproteobacteria bacterium]MXY30875.1 hypothetical protein [Gammaproteobacteria bacterium]MYC99323.1 hypothetical protein [Gammaproteobacteria bacterium]MYF60103.1 hypothetical protein [Gammaproteobacteria bacterium]MYI21336.1 hypothetical protein [Gammaproteobacteria bacterium]
MAKLLEARSRSYSRAVVVVVGGFILGALLTRLAQFMPESATREFLTAAVTASVGPVSVGLVALDITLGPLAFHFNVLTLAGIGILAPIVRAWL